MATQKIIETIDSSGKLHLTNILCRFTGDTITYTETDEIVTDAEADGVIYRKYKGLYLKRDFTGSVNLLWWGVRPNTDIDYSDELISASKFHKIEMPEGVIKTSKAINFSGTCNISGTGMGKTIIDASSADPLEFPNGSVIYIKGAEPALIGTTNVPKVNDSTIVLSETASIEKNDVIMLCDPTDFSFSTSRAVYREGEVLRAKSASTGSTISLQWRIIGERYVSPVCNVYKMESSNVVVSGITVIAPNTGNITGVKIEYITNGTVNSLNVENSGYAGLMVSKCFNVKFDHCQLNKDNGDTNGTSYGVIISNCQNITFDTVHASSTRHAFSTGGTGTYSIVNRFINSINCNFSTANGQGVGAYELHGNAEYCKATSCQMIGGATLSGRRNGIDNCDVFQNPEGNTACVYLSEILEPSITINNCRMYAFVETNNNPVWINFTTNDETEFEGYFTIKNCTFTWHNKLNNVDNAVTGIESYFYGTGQNKVKFDFDNNKFINTDASNVFIAVKTRIAPTSTSNFPESIMTNNLFDRCGTQVENTDLVIMGNKNVFKDRTIYSSIFTNCVSVHFEDNIIKNVNTLTADTNVRASVVFSGCTRVYTGGNDIEGGEFTLYAYTIISAAEVHGKQNSNRGVLNREYNLVTCAGVYGTVAHTGTPEGVFASSLGTRYYQTNGVAGARQWIKDTATGNTGWRLVEPLKATNAQIYAATDDVTFITPKGLKDSIYINNSTSATVTKANLNTEYPTAQAKFIVIYPYLTGGAIMAIKLDNIGVGNWFIKTGTLAV